MPNSLYNNRILVVEDEHIMRMLLIQALDNMGIASISEAESGNRAQEVIQKQTVDIVLSDLEMKHGSGFELIQAIRTGKTHQPRNTPVLVITGYSDLSTLSSVSALDVQGYLVKPVSANQLREKLEELEALQVSVKDAEAYEHLRGDTGNARNNTRQDSIDKSKTEQPGQHPRKYSAKVDVLMLEEGMKLRQDVFAKSTALLRADTVLDIGKIKILQDMRSLLDNRQIDVVLP